MDVGRLCMLSNRLSQCAVLPASVKMEYFMSEVREGESVCRPCMYMVHEILEHKF